MPAACPPQPHKIKVLGNEDQQPPARRRLLEPRPRGGLEKLEARVGGGGGRGGWEALERLAELRGG
jgi:hypothetical protein